MRFRIHGADRETGDESVFELSALTVQDARTEAGRIGYLVSKVEVADTSFEEIETDIDDQPAQFGSRRWLRQNLIVVAVAVGSICVLAVGIPLVLFLTGQRKVGDTGESTKITAEAPKPEVTYDGKPTSEWLKLSYDRDQSMRMRAVRALGTIGKDGGASVVDALVERTKDDLPEIRVLAAEKYWALTKEAKPSAAIWAAVVTDDTLSTGARIDALTAITLCYSEANKRLTAELGDAEYVNRAKTLADILATGVLPIMQWQKEKEAGIYEIQLRYSNDLSKLRFYKAVIDFCVVMSDKIGGTSGEPIKQTASPP